MAVTPVGSFVFDDASGANASVNVPTGAGTDLEVAFCGSNFFTLDSGTDLQPSGGGWTLRQTTDRGTDDSKIRIWTRTAPAGAHTVTVSTLGGEEVWIGIRRLAGADLTNPVIDVDGATAANASHQAPALTLGAEEGYLLGAAMSQVFQGNGTYTAPAEFSELADFESEVSGAYHATVAEDQSATGSVGPFTFTYSQADPGLAVMIAIRAGEAPTFPILVANRGTAQNLTSQTSTAVDMAAGASIDTVNNVLIARIGLDNTGGGGAATTVTISDPRGNTWTVGAAANQDPGAAATGISCRIAYCVPTTPYQNGDDITFQYGNSTTAKSIVIEEWSNIDRTTPEAVAQTTANGASGTPSISRTPSAADQLAYAAIGIEGPSGDTYTQDADTTNGSWTSLTSLSTTSGTATNNATVRGAYKVVTASGAQTWNPTITSRDWAAVFLVFNVAANVDEVEPDDADHLHTAESPAITQVHELVPADATQLHVADSPTLTQVHELVPADATQEQVADSPTVAVIVTITPDDTVHLHTADSPVITQVHELAPDEAVQLQVTDSPTVTQVHALVVQDTDHVQEADSPALSQVHALTPDDAVHEQTATQPSVLEEGDIAPDSTVHEQTADEPVITQIHILAPDEAVHLQLADEPVITQIPNLEVADAVQLQVADSPILTQVHILAPDDAVHEQVADEGSVTVPSAAIPALSGTVTAQGLSGALVSRSLAGTVAVQLLAGNGQLRQLSGTATVQGVGGTLT